MSHGITPWAAGFWCSWIMPSACPNSWRTTRWYSRVAVDGSSHPKLTVALVRPTVRASVPTVDHENPFSAKLTRGSLAVPVTKSRRMLATVSHSLAIVATFSCTSARRR